MYIDNIKPYLDFAIDEGFGSTFEYQSSEGSLYKVSLYKAIELLDVQTFVRVNKITGDVYKYYYLVFNKVVQWGNNCHTPNDVKIYVEKLLAMSNFI